MTVLDLIIYVPNETEMIVQDGEKTLYHGQCKYMPYSTMMRDMVVVDAWINNEDGATHPMIRIKVK